MTPAHAIYVRAVERALLADERALERQLADLLAGPRDGEEERDEFATDRGVCIAARRVA